MLQFFKHLFKSKTVDYAELCRKGAQIIDVRTATEYKLGHIRGSLNIPLQTLNQSLGKIKKDSPVITCCASGMRSASASSILKSAGFGDVHNGGGWVSLQKKI
jgi:rhodanese-related sulfurtransferase